MIDIALRHTRNVSSAEFLVLFFAHIYRSSPSLGLTPGEWIAEADNRTGCCLYACAEFASMLLLLGVIKVSKPFCGCH